MDDINLYLITSLKWYVPSKGGAGEMFSWLLLGHKVI